MVKPHDEKHIKVYMFLMCSMGFIGIVYHFETFGVDTETKQWSVFIGLSMLFYLYGGAYMIVMIRHCVDKLFQIFLLLFLLTVSCLVVYVTVKVGTTTTFEQWLYIGSFLVNLAYKVYHLYTIWYYANVTVDVVEYVTTGEGKQYTRKCVERCC